MMQHLVERLLTLFEHFTQRMTHMSTDTQRLTDAVNALSTTVDTLLAERANDVARIADLEKQLAGVVDKTASAVSAETAKIVAALMPPIPAPEPLPAPLTVLT